MPNKNKGEILGALSKGLAFLRPELGAHFLCPACLGPIPLEASHRITKAHIIPKAAGGGISTYLCKSCNNSFGAKQDKWFGERMKLTRRKNANIFEADIKEGHFWIDDVKVNGEWTRKEDGNFVFTIHGHRNSPKVNDLITKKFRVQPPKIDLRFSIPLLENQRAIEIGFLTAGYLLWFKALGYSWALQKHLEPIRLQIQRPSDPVLEGRFLAYCNEVTWHKPWLGIAMVDDELAMVAGLDNGLVLLPLMDRPDLYSRLGHDLAGKTVKGLRAFDLLDRPIYSEPICVGMDTRLLIGPDAVPQGAHSGFVHISSETGESHLMRRVYDDDEWERLKQRPNAILKNIDLGHLK